MKDKDEVRILESLIDEFYKENSEPLNNEIKNNPEYIKQKENLNKVSKKLDILNEDIYHLDIDILGIIEKGEEIKNAKKSKIEFALFIFTSLIILFIYFLMGLIFGARLLVISQFIFLSLAPWLIIPISILKRKGSAS